jgi:hypothetical protein
LRRTLPVQFLLLLALLVSTAQAQDLPVERYSSYQAYVLVGEHAERGRFTCVLRMWRNLEGELVLQRQVRWREGGEVDVTRGLVHLRHGVVMQARLLPLARGMDGALTGPELIHEPDHYSLLFNHAKGRVYARAMGPRGTSRAVGKRWVERSDAKPKKTLVGRLLVLGKDAARDALQRGVDVGETFKLSKFFHVGIGVGVRLLEERHVSNEQLKALRQKSDTVFVEIEAEGRARVPLGTSIPLGQGVTLSLGVSTDTRLRYLVTERYDVPPKNRRGAAAVLIADLKAAKHHVFGLPLTAAEALDRTIGASHALEGDWSAAISGSLGLGQQFDVVGDVVRVGASARVGGFYRLRRSFRMVSTRLEGDDVRLRLVKVRGRDKGGHLRAELGAIVGLTSEHVGLDEHPQSEYIDKGLDAGNSALEGLLRFELKADKGRSHEDELDIAYRFDLSNTRAVGAYELAVRGDWTAAAELANQPGSGVVEEFRIFEMEQRTYRQGEVKISELLRGKTRRDVNVKDLLVTDREGQVRYDVFRFHRKRDWRFLGSLFRSERDLNVELIGSRAAPDATRPRSHTLRYRLEMRDPNTRKSEAERIRRLLHAVGLPGTTLEELPLPKWKFLRGRFGRTRTTIQASISAAGLELLFDATREQLIRGYAAAVSVVEDTEVEWGTADGRRRVIASKSGSERERDKYQAARFQLRRAEQFADALHGLGAATTPAEWSKHLRDLARRDGWKLEVLTALTLLVPNEHVHMTAELDGKRRAYSAEIRGQRYDPLERRRLRGR